MNNTKRITANTVMYNLAINTNHLGLQQKFTVQDIHPESNHGYRIRSGSDGLP